LATCIGTLAASLGGAYSIRSLLKLISLDRLPGRIQTLVARLRFLHSRPA
jgi:hypothetical protein